MAHSKSFTIILISPDSSLLKTYEKLFSKISPSVKIFIFSSSESALPQVHLLQPNLIISDSVLPITKGGDCKKDFIGESPREIPVIIINDSSQVRWEFMHSDAITVIPSFNAHRTIEKMIRSILGC